MTVVETAPPWIDAPPLPAELQVEITSACNLRCTMCLVSYKPPVNKLAGAMTPELFERILDGVPTLRRLTMQGLGEPLLSPYLIDQVRRAKARGLTVGFNSNATLLNRRRADALVAAGLDWLHVSLDGAAATTYESIRQGATFDTVVANLAGLVAAKRAAGSDTPWIRVVFVAMRRNVGELPALVRLLASIGVDELRVQNLSHDFSDTDPSGRYAGIREFAAAEGLWTTPESAASARAAFDAATRVADEHGLTLRLPRLEAVPPEPGRPGCTWPWESVYITSQGVVQPCCMVMGDDRVSLGRLTEFSFTEIWHSPAYREFRRRLAADDPPEVCRGCALYQRTF
ncbi:radical SAM protein [Planosporangium thailandense]|uniref:Radical SAM protein n=1 Tax=Planosporangium thailandense TaxID=765197 RepID=A0ABX0XW88_9ACTN|nr:radical SAM protein [Planosporangium thailandense]NJC70318.1 radical SAM protein [Planosporangium thailandense]